jgi:hypothetical protein
MPFRCAVRGTLNMRTLAPLVDPIVCGQADARASEEIILDLTDVSFVTPGSLAPLAALLEYASVGLPPVRVQAPSSVDCRRYLAAAGLLQMLTGLVTVRGAEDLDGAEPSSAVQSVLPLTKLRGHAELQPFLQDLERRLDDLLGCGDDGYEQVKRPLLSTLRELCDNVFQHAGGAPGWIAAQKYRTRAGTAFVEVAIADAGDGVRRTLATHHTELLLVPDGVALERMVKEGLSRHTDPARGTGYYVLKAATKALGGSFYLRSGSGAVGRPRNGSVQRHDGLSHWPGTHLQLSVTCA